MATQTSEQPQAIRGVDELVERLDRAVQEPTPERITTAVKDALEEMVAGGTFELPAALTEPKSDHYARRLIHRSAEHGYTVIAMTWGTGQGTALHDHSGMWCVEGVLMGNIEVTQFENLEQRGSRFRFERQGTIVAGKGEAGALIPPFEYHTIANRSAGDKAVTLHVYAGEMTECTIFVPANDGWYDRQQRQLCYD
jgi:predicted metal-dependent enzyme (double-stranded beta helix superfamily)